METYIHDKKDLLLLPTMGFWLCTCYIQVLEIAKNFKVYAKKCYIFKNALASVSFYVDIGINRLFVYTDVS